MLLQRRVPAGCAVWSLIGVAYKCPNTKNKNLNFFNLPWNRKITLRKKHFEESYFNKSLDLGGRLNSKDYFMSNLVFDL